MKPAVVSLLLLVGSIPSFAQSVTQYRPQEPSRDQAWRLMPGPTGISRGCPIELRAEQAPLGDMLEVNRPAPKGVSQGLRLVVMGLNPDRIAAATVTVRGFSAKSRMLQTLSSGSGPFDASRTLQVDFPSGAASTGSAFLRVSGLTSIQAIDLKSITYADGSIWKIAEGSVCRIVPDLTMLIGSR